MRADSLPLPHGDNFLHLFHLSAKKHKRVRLKNRLPAPYHCRSICTLINEPSAAAQHCKQESRPQWPRGGGGALQMFPEEDGLSDPAEQHAE